MSEHLPSDQSFAIGEVVILVNCERSFLEGTEATVVGGYGFRQRRYPGRVEECWCWEVRSAFDGEVYYAAPQQLRKKKPPRDDLQIVRWDQCPWQPEHVNG